MSIKKKSEGLSEVKINEILASVPMTELSRNDMSMTIADHQFIVRLLNVWHGATKEDMKKFLKQIYLADNKALCSSIVNTVSKQVAETIAPIYTAIQGLSDQIKEVNDKLGGVIKKVGIHDEDIKALKRYASPAQTALRMGTGILIGLLFATIIALLIHYNLPVK